VADDCRSGIRPSSYTAIDQLKGPHRPQTSGRGGRRTAQVLVVKGLQRLEVWGVDLIFKDVGGER
jgi:hypothetical protein